MDPEEVTAVEMRELTLADVQDDKAAEKGQIKGTKDQKRSRNKSGGGAISYRKAQEEDGETNAYFKVSNISESFSTAALIRSTPKEDKDVYKKLCLFKWISAVFIVLTLVLLAVVLALVVKLYEPQAKALASKAERTGYTSTQEYQCSECAKDWVRVNDSCYFIAKERLSWQESRESCQKQGGDLVVVQNESVQRLLSQTRGLLYWIGLRYSKNEQWMWVNNNALTKNYWAQDQPVLDPQGSCTMLKGQVPNRNNWYSNPCTATSHYICQSFLVKKK